MNIQNGMMQQFKSQPKWCKLDPLIYNNGLKTGHTGTIRKRPGILGNAGHHTLSYQDSL